MAAKKQKSGKPSLPERSPRPAPGPGPVGLDANSTRGRHEQDGVDHEVDKRQVARKNAKPRSARETLKAPNDRKASTSRKSAKRASD